MKNRKHPFATSLAALVVAAGGASAPSSSRVAQSLEVIRLDGQINELLMEAVSRDPAGASGLFSGES